jgi:hypothetical protein
MLAEEVVAVELAKLRAIRDADSFRSPLAVDTCGSAKQSLSRVGAFRRRTSVVQMLPAHSFLLLDCRIIFTAKRSGQSVCSLISLSRVHLNNRRLQMCRYFCLPVLPNQPRRQELVGEQVPVGGRTQRLVQDFEGRCLRAFHHLSQICVIGLSLRLR